MSRKKDGKNEFWPSNAGSGPVPVSSKVSFPGLDHKVLELWDKYNIFQRTIDERKDGPNYVIFDGPPGTNGMPHIGNIMQSALKDLWPRFYTMKGYHVKRKAGWDTHGLPIELTAEKEIGLKTKREIIDYGVEKYIDYCRNTVYRYKDHWTYAIRRIGRFLDTDNYYATLTNDYIQTDWWVLKQAWDKNLLFQGRKVMPHCARCGTSLSAHETAQGYKDITDISLYVKFRVRGADNTYFVAWTTTAWTLLSNVALAVSPDLVYVTIEANEERYILAEARLEALSKTLGDYEVLARTRGYEMEGMEYEPLWNFQKGIGGKAFNIFADDYVNADDGSGIVHLALYGEDDFRIIKKNKLPIVQNVDQDGYCKPVVTPFIGKYFREDGFDVEILKDLAERGLLFGKKKIEHSYPHCYRCGEPLMYYAKTGWFIRTSSYKDKMIEANSSINWYPDYIKDGRFGNWLENNVDWAISRERYWGSPLPIWTCQDCHDQVCVGSLDELFELRGEPLPEDFDPHKPHIDRIELPCKKCGGVMRRETEVLDSWFNAGIMPWGQWGYPTKPGAEELYQDQYPADFICEAIDQTRGWFYTLLATSVLLTGESSFRNVICTELVLDKNGLKMSKSKGNVVDPVGLCEEYGADSVRWIFYSVNPWTVRRFAKSDVTEVVKQVLIPYWNAYSFLVTYARLDKWKPDPSRVAPKALLDRWILSRTEALRESVEEALIEYDVTVAANRITSFIDELTNWYIRRSRRRFWKSEDDSDKQAAYDTLFTVITKLNRILAPFMPFISEVIFQNLERAYDKSKPDSVHLTSWPDPEQEIREPDLEDTMLKIRKVVTIARSLRNEGGVRVRQPLPELVIAGIELEPGSEYQEIILDELNIKQLKLVPDAGKLFTYNAKADFKTLGPRLGGKIKRIANAISNLTDKEIKGFIANNQIEIEGETILREEVVLEQIAEEGLWVKSEEDLTVAVDYRINDDLRAEGIAREFIHHVQNLRRENKLAVTDRIEITFNGDPEIKTSIGKHLDYITSETLAVSIESSDVQANSNTLRIGDLYGTIDISVSTIKE